MDVNIRLAVPADKEACGRIMYEAFKRINERHGFENVEIPTLEVGCSIAEMLIHHPSRFSIVAEAGGCVVGSCFLDEHSPMRGIDTISVDPAFQGQGVGRKLLEAVLERTRGSRGVRLVQHTFNTCSMALYASMGFEVKEPLVLLHGRLVGKPSGGDNPPGGGRPPGDVEVRPMCSQDLVACGALCKQVYGFERTGELQDWLEVFTPYVAVRGGHVVAYVAAPTEWSADHGVAETESDMRALLLGVSAALAGPLSFLLPVRQASLFRWCLERGLRAVKPLTLMALGEYQEPAGCYFPSVLF